MNWLVSSIIILTFLQRIVCHNASGFLIAFIIAFIARLLFCTRIKGIVLKTKGMMIAEGLSCFLVFILSMLHPSLSKILGFLAFLAFSGLVCLLYYVDDKFYVYAVEEYEEEYNNDLQ